MTNDDDWRQWSLKSQGLTWRIALPEDIPALTRLLDAAHLVVGAQERPNLFEFPVILTLVAKDEDGAVVDGLYVEMEAFVRKLGLSKLGMLSAEALVPMLGSFLVSRKVRLGRVAVPKRLARIMAGSMRRMGLTDVTDKFSHWVMKLRT